MPRLIPCLLDQTFTVPSTRTACSHFPGGVSLGLQTLPSLLAKFFSFLLPRLFVAFRGFDRFLAGSLPPANCTVAVSPAFSFSVPPLLCHRDFWDLLVLLQSHSSLQFEIYWAREGLAQQWEEQKPKRSDGLKCQGEVSLSPQETICQETWYLYSHSGFQCSRVTQPCCTLEPWYYPAPLCLGAMILHSSNETCKLEEE